MVQNLKSGSCLLVEINMINLDGVHEVFYFKALLGLMPLMPSGFLVSISMLHLPMLQDVHQSQRQLLWELGTANRRHETSEGNHDFLNQT